MYLWGVLMNIKNIRSKVKKAINGAKFQITLLHDIEVPDGVGGILDISKGEPKFILDCVLDNSKTKSNSSFIQQNEFKHATQDRTPVLICLYDETKMPVEGDYFILGNKKFTIRYIDDVLQLHIYLQCTLEVTILESNNGN